MTPEKFTITFNSCCQIFFISIFDFFKFLGYTVPCLFYLLNYLHFLIFISFPFPVLLSNNRCSKSSGDSLATVADTKNSRKYCL